MEQGRLEARIAFVFCSRERGESEETDRFLDQVSDYGIPLVTLSFTRFRREHGGRGTGFDGADFAPWREAYDLAVAERLQGYRPDVSVLAGYMLVMTPALCQRITALNLHPAAPAGPVGTWQQVVWTLIEERADSSGVFMHVVTPELDKGPIATYCRYPLRGPDIDLLWQAVPDKSVEDPQATFGEDFPLFRRIREEGVARELPLILATLKVFSEGRIQLLAGRPYNQRGQSIPGYDLSQEIEEAVSLKAGRERKD